MRRITKITIAVLFLIVDCYVTTMDGVAQEIFPPDSIKKIIEAHAIETDIKIDGILSESEWQIDKIANDFYQVFPVQGAPLEADSEVKILYNTKSLYIAATCKYYDGKKNLRAPSFKRDHEVGNHDTFGIAIDGFNDQRNAMVFVVDPWGTQRDQLSFDDQLYDVDWDALWKVRTSRGDSAWIAEIEIPWETLRYKDSNGDSQEWGIQFFRVRRKDNEGSTWSRMPRAYVALRMPYAGRLIGLTPPPPSPNIRVQPYALGTSDYQESTSGIRKSSDLKLGGEAKWAINSNAVLDLTVNTDFAQADVDRQVNNITRFNVFFPERRQFFLENASLFGAGLAPIQKYTGGSMIIRPFFSRRIGLDEDGNIIPITGGARFVFRSAKRSYGAMYINEDDRGAREGANFLVGRFAENLGKQTRLGVLISNKSNSQWGDHKTTTAVDGFFRLNQNLSLSTMAITNRESANNGKSLGGYARLHYLSNELIAYWTQSIVPKGFVPSVGFVSRTDVIATTPGFYMQKQYSWLPDVIRFFEPGVFAEVYHKHSTRKLQEASINISPIFFQFQKGGYFGYYTQFFYQNLDAPFTPLGITITEGTYKYVRHSLVYSTDQSKKYSVLINYEFGDYYDRQLQFVRSELRVAPIPHASVRFSVDHNVFTDTNDGAQSDEVTLYNMETRLAINPRIQLTGFYQRNTLNKSDNWNVRLAWEFRPLSFVYLIFNQKTFDEGDVMKEQNAIAKISYLKQF